MRERLYEIQAIPIMRRRQGRYMELGAYTGSVRVVAVYKVSGTMASNGNMVVLGVAAGLRDTVSQQLERVRCRRRLRLRLRSRR